MDCMDELGPAIRLTVTNTEPESKKKSWFKDFLGLSHRRPGKKVSKKECSRVEI
jgi:hypothetical protein